MSVMTDGTMRAKENTDDSIIRDDLIDTRDLSLDFCIHLILTMVVGGVTGKFKRSNQRGRTFPRSAAREREYEVRRLSELRSHRDN